jgi:hypothetical protein
MSEGLMARRRVGRDHSAIRRARSRLGGDANIGRTAWPPQSQVQAVLTASRCFVSMTLRQLPIPLLDTGPRVNRRISAH